MKIVDFKKPKILSDAYNMAIDLGNDCIIMAGGTSFQFMPDGPEKTAININKVIGKKIKEEENSFIIEAGSRIADIQEFKKEGWVLDTVATKLSTQQIRNMSTIGGNIARIFPWSDFPVALLALKAKIRAFEGCKIDFKAKDFFAQQPANLLKNKAIVTSVQIPKLTSSSGFGYHKEVRTSGGFSTLTAAAFVQIKKNKIKKIRIAAGAALGLPTRLKAIEKDIKGKNATEQTIKNAVIKHIESFSWKGKEGASDKYALNLAKTIISDVVLSALKQAEGGKK